MAKKNTPTIAPEAPTKTRNKVLKKYTATQLHELIGDEPIGVSFKELSNIVLRSKREEFLKGL